MMPSERFKTRAAVYLLLFKDGQVLLVKRAGSGYHDGEYGLPSGHLEAGESLTEAIAKETEEEIGIRVKREAISLAHVVHRSQIDPPYLDFFFAVREWEGAPVIREPEKCSDLIWADIGVLSPETIPYIREVIESVNGNVLYSENLPA